MKKWLFSTILGAIVFALGISVSRAQFAAALAAKAQAAAALAAQTAANAKSGEPLSAPDNSASKPNQPAASNDTAPSAPEGADKRPLPVGDALPVSSDSAAQTAPTGTPAPESASQIDERPKILIFPVKHRDAASLAELIKLMQPEKGDKIYADPRNNSLICPDGFEQKFLTILQLLDTPASKNTFDRTSGADNAALTLNAQGRMTRLDRQSAPAAPDSLTRLPIVGRLFDHAQTASVDMTSSPAGQEYHQYDAHALELANAYRQQQAAAPRDAKRLDQLKAELQAAVHDAFHARQTWQRSQAAQLRTRLEQIERRISDRGQMADEVIQRRVEELLHPERQWEQENDAEYPPQVSNRQQESIIPHAVVIEGNKSIKTEEIMTRLKTRAEQVIDPRQLQDDVRALMSTRWFVSVESRIEQSNQGPVLIIRVNEKTMRNTQQSNGRTPAASEAADGSVPGAATTPAHPVDAFVGDRAIQAVQADQAMRAAREISPDSAGDPRKRMLDAALDVNAARAAIDRAQALLAISEEKWKVMQSVPKGAVPMSKILDARNEVSLGQAELQKLVADLEIRERQQKDAREMLAARIKFLELDLADAKLRMQHADDEFSRTDNLFRKGAMATAVFEEKRLAQRLAASQYERAQMLLELYRKALPAQEASAETGQSDDELQLKGVWRTDFVAAQEMALKIHRPMVVLFWTKTYEPSQKLNEEMHVNPDVLRLVGKHFVAVTVEEDAYTTNKSWAVRKLFDVYEFPSVLVLSEDGRILGRKQGTLTAAELVDLLKENLPEFRKDRPAGLRSADEPARRAAEDKPGAPRPGGSDARSDEKPNEATPKPGDRPNAKPEE